MLINLIKLNTFHERLIRKVLTPRCLNICKIIIIILAKSPRIAKTKASSEIVKVIMIKIFIANYIRVNITVKLAIVFRGTKKNFQLFRSDFKDSRFKKPEHSNLIMFTPAK